MINPNHLRGKFKKKYENKNTKSFIKNTITNAFDNYKISRIQNDEHTITLCCFELNPKTQIYQ